MSFDDEKPVRVTRDGETLVVAYPSARPPLVWRFDLARHPGFTLSLQGADENWELGISAPKEPFQPFVRFRSRDDAEEAFERTQEGLLKKKSNIWRSVAFGLVALLALVIIFFVIPLSRYASAHPPMAPSGRNSALANPSMFGGEEPVPPPLKPLKEGVPMSADDVLKPPP
ncbi:MAG: hypothetical protein M3N08_00840 [Pseudomonadota bacterium]|nr:hypothetical protein [Pseudomonadota bacterium]